MDVNLKKEIFPLWQKVIVGLVIGVILGYFLGPKVIYLKPVGDLFIRLLKMIIVPLIFFAIVGGVSQVSDTKLLGRLGLRASLAYLFTTSLAIVIGLTTAWLLKPGAGLKLSFSDTKLPQIPQGSTVEKVFQTLVNVVPDNAIGAMAEGSFLQVVFFALFTGIILNLMPESENKRLSGIFQLLASMVFKMVHVILQLAPYAACALTAWVIGTQGAKVLSNLARLVFTAYAAFGVQYLVFGLLIWLGARLSPKPFYKKSLEYQAIALSTSSTKAALPTTIRVCREKLGVSHMGSSFVLPLGASINMDGLAIYLGVCALFFAQALGVDLSWQDYGMILLTATLGSIGGAGIPGAAIVMLPMVLGSVGLPLEGIAIIAGIDRIIDMARSSISITGDVAVTLWVEAQEGSLDREKYYG